MALVGVSFNLLMYYNERVTGIKVYWKWKLPPSWSWLALTSFCHAPWPCHSFKGCSLPPSLLLQLEMFQNWRKVCVAEADQGRGCWVQIIRQKLHHAGPCGWVKTLAPTPNANENRWRVWGMQPMQSQGRGKSEMLLGGIKCEVICRRLRRTMHTILNVGVATSNILKTLPANSFVLFSEVTVALFPV